MSPFLCALLALLLARSRGNRSPLFRSPVGSWRRFAFAPARTPRSVSASPGPVLAPASTLSLTSFVGPVTSEPRLRPRKLAWTPLRLVSSAPRLHCALPFGVTAKSSTSRPVGTPFVVARPRTCSVGALPSGTSSSRARGVLVPSFGTFAAPSSIPGPRSTSLVTLIMGFLRRCSIIQGRMVDSSLRIGSGQGVRPGVVGLGLRFSRPSPGLHALPSEACIGLVGELPILADLSPLAPRP